MGRAAGMFWQYVRGHSIPVAAAFSQLRQLRQQRFPNQQPHPAAAGKTASTDLRHVAVGHKDVGCTVHIPVLTPGCGAVPCSRGGHGSISSGGRRRQRRSIMQHSSPAKLRAAAHRQHAISQQHAVARLARPPCVFTSTCGAPGCPAPRSSRAESVMHCGVKGRRNSGQEGRRQQVTQASLAHHQQSMLLEHS